jgi:hypothetical protein
MKCLRKMMLNSHIVPDIRGNRKGRPQAAFSKKLEAES